MKKTLFALALVPVFTLFGSKLVRKCSKKGVSQ